MRFESQIQIAFELFSSEVHSGPSHIDRNGVQLLGSLAHKHTK